MTAGSSAWDDWFGEYPVMLKNGVEGKKLNPNDYTKHTDGTTADITSGNEGDVMVAFPIKGLKISTDSNNVITVSMTDNPNAESDGFKYYAHSRGSSKKEKFYIGAYLGYKDDNDRLRSLSGKTITDTGTIGAFRTYARNNSPASDGNGGSGYDMWSFFPLTFIQAMYCLKYKNLNSQAVVGKGITSGSVQNTGGTETNGLNYGDTTSGTTHVKCFGIEDLWGNYYLFLDGVVTDSSRNALTATQGFNDTGSGYTNQGLASQSTYNSYPWKTKICGTSEKGFIIYTAGGSDTTYWCDISSCISSRIGTFSGGSGTGTLTGIFYLDLYWTATTSGGIGARLMYL